MHINLLGDAETRSISIAASPGTVLDLLADPHRLPDWAPAFASAVQPDGQDWIVDSGETQANASLVNALAESASAERPA